MRYFFDFDGVPDHHGIMLLSDEEACIQAVRAIPAVYNEKLSNGFGSGTWNCVVRGDQGIRLYEIKLTIAIKAFNEVRAAP